MSELECQIEFWTDRERERQQQINKYFEANFFPPKTPQETSSGKKIWNPVLHIFFQKTYFQKNIFFQNEMLEDDVDIPGWDLLHFVVVVQCDQMTI